MKNKSAGINWATKKDERLFVLLKLSSKSSEIADLCTFIEDVVDSYNTITQNGAPNVHN